MSTITRSTKGLGKEYIVSTLLLVQIIPGARYQFGKFLESNLSRQKHVLQKIRTPEKISVSKLSGLDGWARKKL